MKLFIPVTDLDLHCLLECIVICTSARAKLREKAGIDIK